MNKKLLTPLFIAASFAMIACSANEIVSRPSWVDSPIVEGDYKDNTLKEIYDAIKNLGDTNSSVLNKVMYDVARKHIGTFVDIKDDEGKVTEKGWIRTIALGEATDAEIDSFISDHPIYKSDDKIYKLNGEDVEEIDISDASIHAGERRANSIEKIKKQYNRIMDDIYKKLFDEIKGGSYSTKIDKLYQEDYFVQHLYKEMYYDKYDPVKTPEHLVKDRVFIPKTANDTWENYVNAIGDTATSGFLHVTDANHNITEYYSDYVARKLLPEIYRTLLIENYVREQRATNLGRSYARKVNMITIPTNSDPIINSNIRQMLYNFTDSNITGKFAGYDLETITKAMTGFETNLLVGASFEPLKIIDINGVEHELVWKPKTDKNGLESSAENDIKIYKGTKLYDIVEKYTKIFNIEVDGSGAESSNFHYHPKGNLNSDELSAYNDLTSNGVIPVEKGIVLKERELRLTDMTQDGWFLKNGGLTDLDESFRNKLFNITTANIIDSKDDMEKDKPSINDTVRYFDKGSNDHIAFVYDDKGQQGEAYKSIVLEGSSNFYIVEVLEAASASKLSREEDADGSYEKIKATAVAGASNGLADEIIRNVTEQVANDDTYKKNAEQYYLMISNILFYDQSVYDYFKSQFPDLFK